MLPSNTVLQTQRPFCFLQHLGTYKIFVRFAMGSEVDNVYQVVQIRDKQPGVCPAFTVQIPGNLCADWHFSHSIQSKNEENWQGQMVNKLTVATWRQQHVCLTLYFMTCMLALYCWFFTRYSTILFYVVVSFINIRHRICMSSVISSSTLALDCSGYTHRSGAVGKEYLLQRWAFIPGSARHSRAQLELSYRRRRAVQDILRYDRRLLGCKYVQCILHLFCEPNTPFSRDSTPVWS
jgi:hypothetical protein